MRSPALIEFYRAFLINKSEDAKDADRVGSSADACYFHFSVVSTLMQGRYEGDTWVETEKPFYQQEWNAEFSVRVGSATVVLHSVEYDPLLRLFDQKLVILRNEISSYLKIMKKAVKKGIEQPVFKRTWLNPDSVVTPFTGHIAYEVGPNGKFMLGSCERSIVLWTSVYKTAPRVYPDRHLEIVQGILDGTLVALAKLKTLRERFRTGELSRQEFELDANQKEKTSGPTN